MRFIPKESFEYIVTDETGTTRLVASYVEGHEYHCRTPQMEEKAIAWAEEGKVKLNGNDAMPVRNPQETA